jgi:hypothetical protein
MTDNSVVKPTAYLLRQTLSEIPAHAPEGTEYGCLKPARVILNRSEVEDMQRDFQLVHLTSAVLRRVHRTKEDIKDRGLSGSRPEYR